MVEPLSWVRVRTLAACSATEAVRRGGQGQRGRQDGADPRLVEVDAADPGGGPAAQL
jgi:hypothetical protein